MTPIWLCELLNCRSVHEIVSASANGSTVNMLPTDALSKLPLSLPPGSLIKGFDTLRRELLKKQHRGVDESRTLATTRDLLLPKLMSGEIRIKGAEKVLEDVL